MIRLYTFLIFVAIFTAVLYAVFVMPRPEFVGNTSLLVTAENVVTATNLDYIINDIVYISQDAIEDDAEVQKNGAKVKIERVQEHNIIELSVLANSVEDVETVEYSAISEMTQNIKKQYSLDKDLTIKVLEKDTVTQTYISRVAPYVVMVIVAIGMIAGVLALFALLAQKREEEEYDDNIDGKKIFGQYNSQDLDDKNVNDADEYETANISIEETEEEFVDDEDDNSDTKEEFYVETMMDEPNKELETEDEIVEIEDNQVDELKDSEESVVEQDTSEEYIEDNEKIIEDEEYLGKTPHIAGGSPQKEVQEASQVDDTDTISGTPAGLQTTPGNLPVIDINEIGFEGCAENNEDTCSDEDVNAEPTEEELKARLNELLNGKL
jgi:hypothetical protein